jgi:hypothetical protein
VNRRFGGTYRQLQPTAQAVSSLVDFYTLKMEATCSSKTSVQTISTWGHIPEDGILHSHRYENLKSYKSICLFVFLPTLSLTQIIQRRVVGSEKNELKRIQRAVVVALLVGLSSYMPGETICMLKGQSEETTKLISTKYSFGSLN